MFQYHFLKFLIPETNKEKKGPLTLAQLKKKKSGDELAEEIRQQLGPNDQEKVRIAGLDEFAGIKKHLPRLLEANKHETSVTALESYLKSFPRSTEAYFLLASVYEHAGAYDRALEAISIAISLDSENGKVRRKLQLIEDKVLGQQRSALEMKVKCYSTSPLFEKWASVESYEALDVAIQNERHRQIAADLTLLSPLSSGISLDSVSQYYDTVEDQYDAEPAAHVKALQKRFRLQEIFPFQCIATTALPVGSLVMSDIPFAIAPLIDPDNPKLFATCFHCLKERPILDQGFACPLFPNSCPFIFCSPECVMRNVNIHRQECRLISSIVFPLAKETGFSPGFVLLVLRALCRAHLERSLRKPEAEELQFFFRLHSFTSDYKSQRPWIWNCISSLSRGLCLFLPLEFRLYMAETELSEFIATIHSNVIPISYDPPAVSIQHTAPTASLGLALCHNICSLGHSCVPTCTYVYTSDGRVVLRSLVDIPNEGLLTASFVDDLFLPTARRKNLESSWKVLICSCKRCREVHEGNRHPSGQRCFDCVRGVKNPLCAPILRGILNEQMKEHPRRKATPNENKEENVKIPEIQASGWYCTLCGILSPLDSNRCDVLEVKINHQLDEARSAWAIGETLKARKILEEIVHEYSTQLHPNHHILYNVHVFLVGLWSHGAGRNLKKALHYLKKAILAASAVLPPYHVEKAHLFSSYADICFALSVNRKTQHRGLWTKEMATSVLSSENVEKYILFPIDAALTPIEAQWLAVVNAWISRGPKSAQWIFSIQRLRHLAQIIGQHTPPLLYVPKITNAERVAESVRRLLRNSGLTTKEIVEMIARDHRYLLTAACAQGDIVTLEDITKSYSSTKREIETMDLMTGWTALAQAAVSGKVEVVRHLLEVSHANLFSENEWKITPLLAMASKPLDLFDQTASKQQRREEDRNYAIICQIFVQKCRDIEKERLDQLNILRLTIRKDINVESFPFLRQRLLNARSHELLGWNTAAHFAAIRQKPCLLSQVIRSGLNVNCRNIEGATPLHLAAIVGQMATVEELTRLKANVNARNYRGETALMLACFGLHAEVVSHFLNHGECDVTMVASQSTMQCLHTLVLGLTRTHKSRFMGSNKAQDDMLLLCLGGVNPSSSQFTQNSIQQSPVIYLSMPVFEQDGSSLFLFPTEFLRRLSLAEDIVRQLFKVCPPAMFGERTRVGYTASELLQHRLEYLLQEYQQTWGLSDLRLVALSHEERLDIRQKWRDVFNRMDKLIQLLAIENPYRIPEVVLRSTSNTSIGSPDKSKKDFSSTNKPSTEKPPSKGSETLKKSSLKMPSPKTAKDLALKPKVEGKKPITKPDSPKVVKFSSKVSIKEDSSPIQASKKPVLAAKLPTPKLPAPKLTAEKLSTPKLPAPKLTAEKLPAPKLPTPKLPTAKLPGPPKKA